MKHRMGKVKLFGEVVGLIEEIKDGTRFSYTADWLANPVAVPVSLTIPLRAEPFESRGLHPFFDNLLPEGWLLRICSESLQIDRNDRFGLLLATCVDCVGAVEIEPATNCSRSAYCRTRT